MAPPIRHTIRHNATTPVAYRYVHQSLPPGIPPSTIRPEKVNLINLLILLVSEMFVFFLSLNGQSSKVCQKNRLQHGRNSPGGDSFLMKKSKFISLQLLDHCFF